mmetsp:Transcript_646/g.1599  ORF Transcript_646/g.1599 Transcript_646/m.1599 type:complete len:639 (-) Transcript_646:184-2100(-)
MDDNFLNDLVDNDFDMLLPSIEGTLLKPDSPGPLHLGEQGGPNDGMRRTNIDSPWVNVNDGGSSSDMYDENHPKRIKRESSLDSEQSQSQSYLTSDAYRNNNNSNGDLASVGTVDSASRKTMAPARGNKSGITTKGATSEEEKRAKRRKQIAAASRASRARRKRELEDLREENQRLRDERSQFLSKIGELQVKVENMRERGSTDMRVENALLRAQLEEHKRFVSCFKYLCDGAPSASSDARQMIHKQGSDSAQAHVLGLISQSLADHWIPGRVPANLDIPFQNFQFYYKFKDEYGEKPGSRPMGTPARQRLNVRVDITFPGLPASTVAEFVWNSMSNPDIQRRLYRVNNIELAQLADDMPDADTKMLYFREKREAPQKDQDWAVVCNRRQREMALSTLASPSEISAADVHAAASDLKAAQESTATSMQSFMGNFMRNFLSGSALKMFGGKPTDPTADSMSIGASAVPAPALHTLPGPGGPPITSTSAASSSSSAPSGMPHSMQRQHPHQLGALDASNRSVTPYMPPSGMNARMRYDVNKRVDATVVAMSTTQHSAVTQAADSNRITSLFIQGSVIWNQGSDSRIIIVFSFPDDFSIKAMEKLEDVVTPDGTMSGKFADVIKEFNEMLGEQGGTDGFIL